MYNPQNNAVLNHRKFETSVSILVLDDPILAYEVEAQIRTMKCKSCGPDGLSPGILRLLPAQWILTIQDRKTPVNYRGINVVNCLAKLFDLVLNSRLNSWFVPYREQAGRQKGRGCIEHIVILRLLMDMARKKRLKLLVTFVDFACNGI